MRMPSWNALVKGLLCAALWGSSLGTPDHASAQGPGPMGGGGYEVPGMGGLPGIDGLPSGPAIPQVPYGGPGAPPPTGWPHVSPFMVQNRETLLNRSGVWEHEADYGPRRKYKTGIDYLMGWGSKPGPDVLIGDPNAYLHSYPTDDEFDFPPFTRLTNYDPNSPQPFPWWPARRTNGINNMDHFGVRATFGWENYDQSEWQLSGWVLLENEVVLGGFGQTRAAGDIDLQVFRLPLFDGTPSGTNIPYDDFLEIRFDQLFYGVDFDYWNTPFFESKNFMLRMEMGVKYLFIRERFQVIAGDSGIDYTYTADDGAIDNILPLINPFTTRIDSSVNSHLVGPMIGLRGDLGGDAFKIIGQVKVGAAANIESSSVTGDNVRSQFDQFLFGPGPATTKTREHTYITPLFQTGISGEFGFFSYLPGFRSIPVLNLAKLRIGYDYTLVGNMSRPHQIIQYNVNVLENRTKRQSLSVKTVNFGLDWTY